MKVVMIFFDWLSYEIDMLWQVKKIEDELDLVDAIKQEITLIDPNFPDISRLNCLICLNVNNIFLGMLDNSSETLYDILDIDLKARHPTKCFLSSELINAILKAKTIKDLLVERLLCGGGQLEISKIPFGYLPRELNQIILKFFKVLRQKSDYHSSLLSIGN